jgi:hypothetical protein
MFGNMVAYYLRNCRRRPLGFEIPSCLPPSLTLCGYFRALRMRSSVSGELLELNIIVFNSPDHVRCE